VVMKVKTVNPTPQIARGVSLLTLHIIYYGRPITCVALTD
jgi:hypothetical protein